MNIPMQTLTGGNIPEVEDGLAVGRFIDIVERKVDAFVTESDRFGHADDGRRLDFVVTLLDENRKPVLREDAEGPDDTVDLRQAKACKPGAVGERSNFYAYLKGILTPTEFQLWLLSGKGDAQADAAWQAAAEKVGGREVNIQVSHNDKGYPQIEAFLGPAKAKK